MTLKSQKRIDIDHSYDACLKMIFWQLGSGNILSDKKNPLNPYLLILKLQSNICKRDLSIVVKMKANRRADPRGQRRFGSSTEMKEFVKDPSRESSDHRRDEGECDGPTDKP